MKDNQEFSFADSSIAEAYDSIIGPIIFEPWADRMIQEHSPWTGRRVLDLATGTGILAERLARNVGPDGAVIAADISPEMLTVAAQRCAGLSPEVKFIESPAHPLDLPSDSIDFVVCQQGLQFFPDRSAAVEEIYRVLSDGGRVVASTWCPVDECDCIKAVCDSLEAIGENELSDTMRIPFDMLPQAELITHFDSAGFANVSVQQQQMDMVFDRGIEQALQMVYATPIGPQLRSLSDEKQGQFRAAFAERLHELTNDGITMGRMTTNVIVAEKSTRPT